MQFHDAGDSTLGFTMRVWHGSNVLFSRFSMQFFGAGEGGSGIPYGIYFAENREGGEYFARYLAGNNGSSYLYEVELNIQANEVLEEDHNDRESLARLGDTLVNVETRYQQGELARFLRSRGIHCCKLWEGTKPGHGFTFRCISPERASIIGIETYTPANPAWRRIK
ncbi:hypothetical protein RA210_U70170 [Rubrivivax sp. A210]|nr:hypothetical protein RA210_U70170 [Rubrivivax sp. A210]